MLERFRLAAARTLMKGAARISSLPWVPEWVKSTWSDIAFRVLVKEGYKANAAVWACVRVYARSLPEPPLLPWRKGTGEAEPLLEHPIRTLLEEPNPWMSEDEFWSFFATYLALGGNCYVWKERAAATGQLIGLWPLHDGQMAPVPGKDTWIRCYEYDDGAGRKYQVPPEDVIQVRWAPDPLQPTRGLSPLVAAARAVDADNEALRYVFALLKNDAVPRTVLTISGNMRVGNQGDNSMIEELRARFSSQYGGDNRGGIAVLQGADTSIARVGANLDEMASETLHNIPETRISAAFEVPAVLAQLNVGLQRAINANAQELIAWHTRNVIVPLWRRIAAQFWLGLRDEFSFEPGTHLAFDLSQVQALRLEDLKLREQAVSSYEARIVTLNEARAVHRLPPVEGGDEIKPAAPPPMLPPPREEEPQVDEGEEGEEEEGAIKGRAGLDALQRDTIMALFEADVREELDKLRERAAKEALTRQGLLPEPVGASENGAT